MKPTTLKIAITGFCVILLAGVVSIEMLRRGQSTDKPAIVTFYRAVSLHKLCFGFFFAYDKFPDEEQWKNDLDKYNRHIDNLGLDAAEIHDAWGSQFVYRFPGNINNNSFDLYSIGPNKIDEFGSGDDLGAWDKSGFPPYLGGDVFSKQQIRLTKNFLEQSDR